MFLKYTLDLGYRLSPHLDSTVQCAIKPGFHIHDTGADYTEGTFHAKMSTNKGQEWYGPTAVFLPGKSYGRRSLLGYSPQGRKESDTTERLYFHLSL